MKTNIWYKWKTWDEEFYATNVVPPKSKYIPIPKENLSIEELAKWMNDNSITQLYNQGTIGTQSKYASPYDESPAEDLTNPDSPAVDLPEGFYQYQSRHSSPYSRLIPISIRDDLFIKDAKDDVTYNEILKEFQAFNTKKHIYDEIGIIYKRSVLMYGPPGEGKTSIIRNILKNELPKNTVVIFFSEMPGIDFLIKVSKSLPNRLKVFVFEELTQMLEKDGESSQEFLDFMDGEKSVSNSFIFGTTNYPERLPENLTNRPSRWDKVIKMKGLSQAGKVKLMEHFKVGPSFTLNKANKLDDLSTAAVKELCIMMRLHDLPFDEALQKLKDHSNLVKRAFEEKGSMGIG